MTRIWFPTVIDWNLSIHYFSIFGYPLLCKSKIFLVCYIQGSAGGWLWKLTKWSFHWMFSFPFRDKQCPRAVEPSPASPAQPSTTTFLSYLGCFRPTLPIHKLDTRAFSSIQDVSSDLIGGQDCSFEVITCFLQVRNWLTLTFLLASMILQY